MTDRPARLLLLAALTVLVLARLPSLDTPPGFDQAIYTLAAREIGQGRLLYRDVFDHKPPAVYFLYAPVALAGSHDGLVVALADLLLAVLALVLAERCGRRLWGDAAGGLAALVLALTLASPAWGGSLSLLEPEAVGNAVLLACLSLSLAPGGLDVRGAALVGAATALLAGIKTPLALLVLPLVALGLPEDTRARPRLGLALVGGALLATLPLAAYLTVAGLWADAWSAVVSFNLAYGGIEIPNPLGSSVVEKLPALLLPLLLTLPALRAARRERRPGTTAVALWLVVAVALLLVQGKYFFYHFLPLLPPLALLAGRGASLLVPPAPSLRRSLAVVVLVVQLLVLGRALLLNHRPWVAHRLRGGPAYAFAEGVVVSWGTTWLQTELLAAVVRSASRPDETLLVLGRNPLLYLRAHRRPATPWVAHPYLFLRGHPWDRWGDAAARRDGLRRMLRTASPACVVVATGDRSIFDADDAYARLTADDEVYGALREHYELKLRVRRAYLWVRRSVSAPPGASTGSSSRASTPTK